MQRERERERVSLLFCIVTRPASCHSRVIPVSRFVRARFNISVSPSLRNLRFYLPAGDKSAFSHLCAWFLFFRSSWDSCIKCIIIWIVPILSVSLSLSISLSLPISLCLEDLRKSRGVRCKPIVDPTNLRDWHCVLACVEQ